MKTILVPTDFSENAFKALEYASFLAIQISAKIVVLNAYQIPSGTSNVMINFADILEKDANEGLSKLMNKLSSQHTFKNVEYIPLSCYGFLIEAIEIASKHHEVDLVVMGTAGASHLKGKIFGSNTIAVIRKTNYPIVVVPNQVEFLEWKNIILASNEDDSILSAVKVLNSFVNSKEVNIDIVSVESKNNDSHTNHAELIHGLKGWHYELHTEKNDNIVDGIINYTENHQSDIIVLLRKSYSFIERILHSSVTKKLALHSNKPLFLFKT
ncbi:MAG: universal stress protein [Crocinitomicaceae bacterium]